MWTDVAVAALCAVVAFLFANVGLGGGLLYLPILGAAYAWSPPTLVALTHLFSVATLAASAWGHWRSGLVRGRLAIAIGVPMMLAATLGARATLGNDARTVRYAFAVVLCLIAGKMVLGLRRPKVGAPRTGSPRPTALGRRALRVLVPATAVGFLSGAVGIGGGVLLVPILLWGAGLGTREAVGTAAFALVWSSCSALATYAAGGAMAVPAGTVVAVLVATLAGAMLGTRLGLERLRGRHVRAGFVAVLVIAAVSTVWR
ncbi:MAG: sulfite exporter TauE/SafE family protein [Deltaproteobacteria bacterium]|nr:sulfite exporter TauE/SafE family protein [Deltaproteobacteria bacterium]